MTIKRLKKVPVRSSEIVDYEEETLQLPNELLESPEDVVDDSDENAPTSDEEKTAHKRLSLYVENFKFFTKELNIGIGECETQAGGNPGYLSRLKKQKGAPLPSAEFLLKTAEIFGQPIDTLLTVKFTKTSPTERKVVGFIYELIKKTKNDQLTWERQPVDTLSQVDYNGNVVHPLMTDGDGPEPIYYTKAMRGPAHVTGDFYKLEVSHGESFYITKIEYDLIPGEKAFEFYYDTIGASPNLLCCGTSKADEHLFYDALGYLYGAVARDCKHFKLTAAANAAIDKLMK